MHARIYRPSKTAMQSGRARARSWVVEYVSDRPRTIDSLMGWTSAADTAEQVRLEFPTRDEAVAYARRHGLHFTVQQPHERRFHARAYADNFRYHRVN